MAVTSKNISYRTYDGLCPFWKTEQEMLSLRISLSNRG